MRLRRASREVLYSSYTAAHADEGIDDPEVEEPEQENDEPDDAQDEPQDEGEFEEAEDAELDPEND
eukprot:5207657-Amphidinium_carterae.1